MHSLELLEVIRQVLEVLEVIRQNNFKPTKINSIHKLPSK